MQYRVSSYNRRIEPVVVNMPSIELTPHVGAMTHLTFYELYLLGFGTLYAMLRLWLGTLYPVLLLWLGTLFLTFD